VSDVVDYFPSMFEVVEGKAHSKVQWHVNSLRQSRLELYTSVLTSGTCLYSYWLKNIGRGSFLGMLAIYYFILFRGFFFVLFCFVFLLCMLHFFPEIL
jgi:hypothetical protein